MNKKKWKRLALWIAILLGILTIIVFILFCVLIFNPFESDYSRELTYVVPVDSNAIYYIADPEKTYNKIQKIISWQKLTTKKEYQEFSQSSYFQEWGISSITEQRQQLQEEHGLDILDWKYLSQVIGREILISFREEGESNHFLLVTRITWQGKFVHRMVCYIIANDLEWKSKEGIESIELNPELSLHWSRYRDLLIISDSRNYLKKALTNAEQNKSDKNHFADYVESQKTDSDIHFYYEKTSSDPSKSENLPVALWQEALPDYKAKNYTGTINLNKEKTEIEFQAALPEEENYVFRPNNWNIGNILPKETLFFSTLPIKPREAWQRFRRSWDEETSENARPYLKELDRHFRQKDFLGNCCEKYLREEMAFLISEIDFVKHREEPEDPYPAFTLIFHTADAERFFVEIKDALAKVRETLIKKEFGSKKTDFTFFEIENYDGSELIRIKYPDTSGGAIKPAIGYVDSYVIFSSHKALVRDFADILQQNLGNWSETEKFLEIKSTLQKTSNVRLFIDGDKTIANIWKLREVYRDWYVESNTNSSTERTLRKNFNDSVEKMRYSRIFQLATGAHFEIERQKIRGKIILYHRLRK